MVTEEQQSRATPVRAPEKPTPLAKAGGGVFDQDVAGWELVQRKAKALANSSMMPPEYQGDRGFPNVLVAMELAHRTGFNVMMVAQNLHVIHGRPSWSAKFLIAVVNSSGRFSDLSYRMQGEEGSDDWGCRAVAVNLSTGEELVGTLVTIGMAKAEGWSDKGGSKWQSMPEQMLRYRAATFWTRVYAPELSLGLPTSDEMADVHGDDAPAIEAPTRGKNADLEAALRAQDDEDEPKPNGPVDVGYSPHEEEPHDEAWAEGRE